MYREIDIRYYDADTVYVNGKPHNPKIPVFAGYSTESEATKLNISLPSDWSGNFYLGLNGEYTDAYTDTKIEYVLPAQPHGQLVMQVKAGTLLTAPVVFEVKTI